MFQLVEIVINKIKLGVRAVGRKDFICWQYRKNGAHRKCPSAALGALPFFFFFVLNGFFPAAFDRKCVCVELLAIDQ